jgi:hypothetical protein
MLIKMHLSTIEDKLKHRLMRITIVKFFHRINKIIIINTKVDRSWNQNLTRLKVQINKIKRKKKHNFLIF